MRKKLAMLVPLAALVLACGCMRPPEGTVFIDLDGDGRVDGLAPDRDGDGKPDVNPDGTVSLVSGSEGYATAEAVDSALPDLLVWLGGIIGVPVLIGVGAAWKGARFGRIFMNTVMSIQAARQRLKDKGNIEALILVDETLKWGQLDETVKMVQNVKDKLGLASVSDPVAQRK